MSRPNYADYWPKMKADLAALIGTPYRLGAEASFEEWPPKRLDCSELVELVHARQGISCPDGSWNQHAESEKVSRPMPGDLCFRARPRYIKTGNPLGIYHVGMLYSDTQVVEARAKDSQGRYGKVIFKTRRSWEAYKPFKDAGGWRRLRVLL